MCVYKLQTPTDCPSSDVILYSGRRKRHPYTTKLVYVSVSKKCTWNLRKRKFLPDCLKNLWEEGMSYFEEALLWKNSPVLWSWASKLRCSIMQYTTFRNFLFGWRCIVNYMYNNQLDALSILSSLIISLLHVSGVSTAHHQEVQCIYAANGTCYTSELTVSRPARWQSTQNYNKYHFPHIYIIPPDDGLLIRPKHVEVW
jgi:hypothetical protein